MNRERLLTFVVAVVCVGAVGLAATTLDATLETHPDDVVELEYERLPIGKNDTGSISDEIESNRATGQSTGGGTGGTGEESGGADAGDRRTASPDDGAGPQAAGSGGGDGGGGGGGDTTGIGPGPWPERSLLAMLMDLLVTLLPIALLVGGIALAYRYRRRVRGLVGLVLPSSGRSGNGSASRTPDWNGVEASTEVHRAWLAMVRSLPIDRPWTRTPAECAEIAREVGAEPAVVERLTRTFAEVRYGDRPVTDRRRRIALESRRRFEEGYR